MSRKITITYISNQITDEDGIKMGKKLMDEHPVVFTRITNLSEVFALLSDPHFHTDYFSLDNEIIFENHFADPFTFLNTLRTLIDSTRVKNVLGFYEKRNTKILAIVDLKTDLKTVKQLTKMEQIDGITLRYSNGCTYDDLSEALIDITESRSKIPYKIQQSLKTHKFKIVNSNGFNLTPRQMQIFNLVTERGASNKVIGKILNLSESTVKLHMSSILKKYGVRNRTQLAVFSKK